MGILIQSYTIFSTTLKSTSIGFYYLSLCQERSQIFLWSSPSQTLTMSESETDFGLRRKKSQRREAVLVFYVIFCFPYNYNVLVHCPSCWKIEWLCAMPVVRGVIVWHARSGAECALRVSQHPITMYNSQCPSPNYNVLVHCPSCWEVE